MNAPFYHLVPKVKSDADLLANLKFRREMIEEAKSSPAAAEELWIMCARDIHFWINTFLWIYEPRTPATLPFNTWEFQDEGIAATQEAIGKHDLLQEKSRDMGCSWFILATFVHFWQFFEYYNFLLVSRKEDLVDKTDDPDALFWKVDFLIAKQPSFLKPKIIDKVHRADMKLLNPNTGSLIAGEATTGDIGRGGRRTAIMLDEFAMVPNSFDVLASTAANTKCRIFNSTPKGQGNAFHKLATDGATPKKTWHWVRHPIHAQGLYVDPITGKPRSPWYDNECRKLGNVAALIAQELDINYQGSGYPFFNGEEVEKARARTILPPTFEGDITYDVIGIEQRNPMVTLSPRTGGPLKLWNLLDAQGNPLPGDNKLAVDISGGNGASNSIIAGGNARTGRQTLEYASAHVRPEKLAEIAVALAYWMNAFMIWEANGPGNQFGPKVFELGFRNFYYRRNLKQNSKEPTKTPGWYTTKDSKESGLGDLRAGLTDGSILVMSSEFYDEAKQYVTDPVKGPTHQKALGGGEDGSGAGDQHGDRVIALMLLRHVFKDAPKPTAEDPAALLRPDTLAGRNEIFRREKLAKQRRFW